MRVFQAMVEQIKRKTPKVSHADNDLHVIEEDIDLKNIL